MANVGGILIPVKSVDVIVQEEEENQNYLLEQEEAKYKHQYTGLASYIIHEFYKNRDDKQGSGIEDEIMDSLRQFNGEYTDTERALISSEGGSDIFMNITATKARAAKSWIADIYQSAKGNTWELDSTPIPSLPIEMENMIEEAINREFSASVNPQQPVSTTQAQETIRDINQKKRDIREAIINEISAEASFQMKQMERKVKDQLAEGKFDKALLDFIDDFVVYPTAFLKGPVVSKQVSVQWENGLPVEVEDYVFLNERVDPLDIYPSASATDIQDGNLIEHLRFTDKQKIAALKGLPNYHDDAIDRVLEYSQSGDMWYDTNIESEKDDQERRGTDGFSSDVIHGLHYFGFCKVEDLKEWDEEEFSYLEETDDEWVEVEAILIGNEVIKCAINDDPLRRRPYYKASFINRPGSFWGRSLPMLMKDIQRICNSTVRSLVNNMSIASGPQVEVYIDRLADNGDIEAIYPMKIWQLKSDLTGAGGRAVNWFQPTSNAGELLEIYQIFESKADDVTGIPKYAYGNERIAGAGNSDTGLSMLLESSSKIIKDAVRNIDEGLIKPRVEYQFYYNLLKDDTNFTGDIKVVPRGSSVLTIKAYETLRRNEFLSITANPFDQELMGWEGRADIIRSMIEDLGLPNRMPTNYEIKKRQTEKAQQQQAELEAKTQQEQAKQQSSLQATQIQIEGQKEMAKAAQEVQLLKAQLENTIKEAKLQLENQRLQLEAAKVKLREQVGYEKTKLAMQAKKELQERELSMKEREMNNANKEGA